MGAAHAKGARVFGLNWTEYHLDLCACAVPDVSWQPKLLPASPKLGFAYTSHAFWSGLFFKSQERKEFTQLEMSWGPTVLKHATIANPCGTGSRIQVHIYLFMFKTYTNSHWWDMKRNSSASHVSLRPKLRGQPFLQPGGCFLMFSWRLLGVSSDLMRLSDDPMTQIPCHCATVLNSLTDGQARLLVLNINCIILSSI